MIIRGGDGADAAGMAQILGDWVRETSWMPVLHSRDDDLGFCRDLLAHQEVRVLDDGGVAGFLARDAGCVTCLYLAPWARGRGWGPALLAQAQVASGHLVLWTFQANARAIAFYLRQGFVERARGDGTGNAEALPDVRLEWRREGAA